MRKGIIYVRVSTDEQANTGYSLEYQEERLLKACEYERSQVLRVFREDYSAKDFNRPEFHKLMEYVKSNKSEVEFILFTRWDRFSRNSEEAYRMIRLFKNLNVEVRSLEQPLDMSIPDNKLMLAFYLMAPEIENDKISVRTKEGLYKAAKSGAFTARAPFGYVNVRNESEMATLAYCPENYKLVKEALELFSGGNYSADEIRRRFFVEGKAAKIGKQTFLNIIRNPTYAGKIVVPAFGKDSSYLVDGVHPPIISMHTFLRNTEIINRHKKFLITKERDEFPLRGSLRCPICSNTLTASASRSRNQSLHPYYHCQKGCGYREKAGVVNNAFETYLDSFEMTSEMYDLYNEVFKDFILTMNNGKKQELINIEKEMEKILARKEKIENEYMDDKITADKYNALLDRCENDLLKLQMRKEALTVETKESLDNLRSALMVHKTVSHIYKNADVRGKKEIIGSIFKDLLVFEKGTYRTTQLSILASLIFNDNKGFKEMGKKKSDISVALSSLALPAGLEPATL
jgi:site-specific DNA recombinase